MFSFNPFRKPERDVFAESYHRLVANNNIIKYHGSYIYNGLAGPLRIVMMSDIHSMQHIEGIWDKSVTSHPSPLSSEEKQELTIQYLPPGDILIIAGDLTNSGSFHELRDCNQFLCMLINRNKYRHIVFIAGNHDRTLDTEYYKSTGYKFDTEVQDPIQCRQVLLDNLPSTVHYLQDNSVEIEGLLIYGTPWIAPEKDYAVRDEKTGKISYRWGFCGDEDMLVDKWASIPDNVNILITHMPPYKIGDETHNYSKDAIVNDRQVICWDNIGSRSLLDRVMQIKANLLLHVFGHVHTGYGAYQYKYVLDTYNYHHFYSATNIHQPLFVNCAICDEDNIPCQLPFVTDILPKYDDYLLETFNTEELHIFVSSLIVFQYHIKTNKKIKKILYDYFNMYSLPFNQININNITLFNYYLNNTSYKNKIKNYLYNIYIEYSYMDQLYYARKLAKCADFENSRDFRDMQMVIPNLFIGPLYPTQDINVMRRMNITHIVSCCNCVPKYPNDFEYLVISAEDMNEENISKYFLKCIRFIYDALNTPYQPSTNINSDTTAMSGSSSISSSANGDDISSQNDYIYKATHGLYGNVLVHCEQGMSRSATIVIAYLMYSMDITYQQAHLLVKRARPFICPNDGFVEQLQIFEKRLYDCKFAKIDIIENVSYQRSPEKKAESSNKVDRSSNRSRSVSTSKKDTTSSAIVSNGILVHNADDDDDDIEYEVEV
jgi:Icc-related predicted phosphoesterase